MHVQKPLRAAEESPLRAGSCLVGRVILASFWDTLALGSVGRMSSGAANTLQMKISNTHKRRRDGMMTPPPVKPSPSFNNDQCFAISFHLYSSNFFGLEYFQSTSKHIISLLLQDVPLVVKSCFYFNPITLSQPTSLTVIS